MTDPKETILQWMLDNKIASHPKQAEHIYNRGRFYDLPHDIQAQQARASLYRQWRNSHIFAKGDTESCFKKAILGEPVPQPVTEMFPEMNEKAEAE